jgi:hypothetical protein
MGKFNAIEFELPIGAVMDNGLGGKCRHLGDGRFVTEVTPSGEMSTVIEGRKMGPSPEFVDGRSRHDVRGVLVWDRIIGASKRTTPPDDELDTIFRKVWMVQYTKPAEPDRAMFEQEMVELCGIDWDDWMEALDDRSA